MPCSEFSSQGFTVGLDLFRGDTGETRHLARMRCEDDGTAAAVDLLRMPGEDIECVGVEDEGKLRSPEEFKKKCFGRRLLTQTGADGEDGHLIEELVVVETLSGD